MAVTVVVQLKAAPGKGAELLEFMKGVQEGAIAAGCHSIAVHRDLDDESKVFEVEYWDDREEHEAFVKAAAEAGAFEPFDELLAEPFVITYGAPAKKTER